MGQWGCGSPVTPAADSAAAAASPGATRAALHAAAYSRTAAMDRINTHILLRIVLAWYA
jgi:hypothetical protein